MRFLEQTWALTILNLRSLPGRFGTAVSALLGVAGVVAVFVAVLSIREGIFAATAGAGRDDVALVMRSGATSEMMSVLMRDSVDIVKTAPGVRQQGGKPIASGELFLVVNVRKRTTGSDANVPFRGIEPMADDVRGNIVYVEGRAPVEGLSEVAVGIGAHRAFAGLDVGQTVRFFENDWKIVGVFTAGGSVAETEIWGDLRIAQDVFRRGQAHQSVAVRLESPAAFRAFKDALTADPRLEVEVKTEREFFAEQSELLRNLVSSVGFLIAVLMGIGAVFGALNTMYSAVAARAREIATLRALGFPRVPVVISVMAEAMVLAAAGGLLGGLASYVAFDGFHTSTLNWSSFSQIAFSFQVTPALLAQGATIAVVMGLVGGLFPGIRAARLPITTALREL